MGRKDKKQTIRQEMPEGLREFYTKEAVVEIKKYLN